MEKQNSPEITSSDIRPSYEQLEERIVLLEEALRDKEKMESVYRKILSKDSEIYNLTRAMIDNVPDMVWAKDMEDRYLFVNQSACDNLLMCTSPLEAEGHKDSFFAKREKESGYLHTFGEICVNSDAIVKKSGQKEKFQESGLVRGEELALNVTKSPIFNSSGEIIGTTGCGQDITKTRKIEIALKNTGRILRDVANEVESVAIHGYDENRRVTLWNNASEVVYGYSKKEAMGRKLEDLILPDEMKDRVEKLHRRWLDTGKKIPSGQVVLKNKAGEDVHVFSSYILTKTSLGREMFCIDIDLSPLREAEEERQALREQLLQVQKMEAIGTLAGGIAHDFNNILTIVLGSAELALDQGDISSEVEEYMGQILAAGDRAKKLVNQILTFSRQKDVDKIPVTPGAIVEEVLTLFRSSLPKTIAIEQDIDMNSGNIFVDPTQIHQLCMNLCTNAYHAMEEKGGTLSVSLGQKWINANDFVEVMGVKSGEFVEISFKDTGIGISQSLQEKIFNPYFTTKKAGKGTGMGLAIVHGIVKNYRGFLTCDSEPGKGAVFKVHLPVIPGSGHSEKFESAERRLDHQIVRGSECILLVDDELMLARVQKNVLEMLGYQVIYHSSSIKALEAFKKEPETFELVISDQTMPEMTGLAIAEEMLEIRPTLPVILLTGFSSEGTEEIAKDLGIKVVAKKPITIKDLAVLIRKVLSSVSEDSR